MRAKRPTYVVRNAQGQPIKRLRNEQTARIMASHPGFTYVVEWT